MRGNCRVHGVDSWRTRYPSRAKLSDAPVEESAASGKLLHGPAVAIGIFEEDERPPGFHLDVADVDPALGELGTGGVDVRHHQLQALDGARLRVEKPEPQGDRTGRPGRRELDEAQALADRDVDVRVEA